MATRIWQVDAFATEAFTGNPAAVVPLERPAPERWMRAFAAEMNLSETAFLWPEAEAWRLRWFTPEAEVRLCGHATLASAHVLWESGLAPAGEPVRFATLSGELTAHRRADGAIELDFPARPSQPAAPPPGLAAALGAPVAEWHVCDEDGLARLADEWAVRALSPDFAALAQLPVRGVLVTAPADAGRDFDFVSRFFAPSIGVPEDPVTGSAHCALAVYWSPRLGRPTLTGYQASPRGGHVGVTLTPDRVLLTGTALTLLTATLTEPAEPAP